MKDLLERLYRADTLTREEAHTLMGHIADSRYPEAQVASLLTVYRMRDITVDELLGLRQALIERARPVDLSQYRALDIVGTGGDGKNTFNISTCACFVVAGAGYNVAKHGNYGASSVSGASTVLEQHGVRFSNDEKQLRRSLDACRMAYLHAPLFHPALGAVAPLRRALGVKTVFNLLGPLVNPSRPAYQLLGVADLSQMRLYTNALQQMGMGFTVCTSLDGYDEISLTSEFKVMTNHSESILEPADLGLEPATAADLYGGSTAQEAAAIFDSVLRGTATGAQTRAVLANAAYGIHTVCHDKEPGECLDEARRSLADGRALECFNKFLEINS